MQLRESVEQLKENEEKLSSQFTVIYTRKPRLLITMQYIWQGRITYTILLRRVLETLEYYSTTIDQLRCSSQNNFSKILLQKDVTVGKVTCIT